jgi:hypothetical protein
MNGQGIALRRASIVTMKCGQRLIVQKASSVTEQTQPIFGAGYVASLAIKI